MYEQLSVDMMACLQKPSNGGAHMTRLKKQQSLRPSTVSPILLLMTRVVSPLP